MDCGAATKRAVQKLRPPFRMEGIEPDGRLTVASGFGIRDHLSAFLSVQPRMENKRCQRHLDTILCVGPAFLTGSQWPKTDSWGKLLDLRTGTRFRREPTSRPEKNGHDLCSWFFHDTDGQVVSLSFCYRATLAGHRCRHGFAGRRVLCRFAVPIGKRLPHGRLWVVYLLWLGISAIKGSVQRKVPSHVADWAV